MESVSGAAITISSTHCRTLSAESSPTSCQERGGEPRMKDLRSRQKEANLSKDELCCKVKSVVQLLGLLDDPSLNLQELLHRVLQLLAWIDR